MAKKSKVRLIKESERIILGCFLVKPEIFIEESEGLTPGHFQHYTLPAQVYWDLIDEDKVPHTLTVAQGSDNTDVWEFHKYAHFDKLQDAKAVLLDHSVNKYIEDALERIKTNIVDREAVLNETEKIVNAINTGEDKDYSISSVATQIVRDLIDNPEQKQLSGIKTPLNYLNQVISGWVDSHLVIVAARPGMGKTSFAMQSARVAAEQGKKVGVISLEMSNKQLTTRLVTQLTGVSQQEIDTRDWNDAKRDQVIDMYKYISGLPIKIYDDPEYYDVDAIYHLGRKLAAKGEIDFLIIDYLQLMDTRRKMQNDNSKVSMMSRRMKMLAKNADIPVMLLSQLSRSLESRTDKRPKLSDLRDSGAIEQDADIVLFPFRPSVYDPDTRDTDKVIVEKHRHGGSGICDCRFKGKYMVFDNLTQQEQNKIKAERKTEDIPF